MKFLKSDFGIITSILFAIIGVIMALGAIGDLICLYIAAGCWLLAITLYLGGLTKIILSEKGIELVYFKKIIKTVAWNEMTKISISGPRDASLSVLSTKNSKLFLEVSMRINLRRLQHIVDVCTNEEIKKTTSRIHQ